MNVLSFINQKGGVGKTTSTHNIGAALHAAGKRVLLVDLDAQANLTGAVCGPTAIPPERTISRVLTGKISAADAVVHPEAGLDIICSDISLCSVELELLGAAGRDFVLREALEPLEHHYDYILIDCSPSLSVLTLMALTASTGYVIVTSAQYLPLDGIAALLNTTELIKKRMNPSLHLIGVIVNLYDARRSLDSSIFQAIKDKFEDKVFADIVKYNSKIAEAPAYSKSILEHAPSSAGARAYIGIAAEIVKREEGNGRYAI